MASSFYSPFSALVLIPANSYPAGLSRKKGSLSFKQAKPVPALKLTGTHEPPGVIMKKMNPLPDLHETDHLLNENAPVSQIASRIDGEGEVNGELVGNFALIFQNDINGIMAEEAEDTGTALFAARFLNGMFI